MMTEEEKEARKQVKREMRACRTKVRELLEGSKDKAVPTDDLDKIMWPHFRRVYDLRDAMLAEFRDFKQDILGGITDANGKRTAFTDTTTGVCYLTNKTRLTDGLDNISKRQEHNGNKELENASRTRKYSDDIKSGNVPTQTVLVSDAAKGATA